MSIAQFIELGIGASGDIPTFVLTGLSAGAAVEPLLAEYDVMACTEYSADVTAGTSFTAAVGARVTLAATVWTRTEFASTEQIAFEDD